MPSPERLRAKLNKFISEGCDNLEVLSDFDHTISRSKHNGVVCPTSHRILQLSGLFTQEFEAEVNRLFKHYHAIEVDSEVDFATKYKEMDAWWDITNGMIVDQLDLRDDMLPNMLKNSALALRHGVDSLLERCKEVDVPFTVVSAGIGNFVEAALRPLVNYPGFRVRSNFIQFDAEGRVQGFSKPNIHSLSKNIVLKQQDQRRNVILLGDMPTDTYMVLDNKYETVLSIGFVNDPASCDLDEYKAKFDLLVLNDGNFDVVEQLLAWIARDEEPILPSDLRTMLGLETANIVV